MLKSVVLLFTTSQLVQFQSFVEHCLAISAMFLWK